MKYPSLYQINTRVWLQERGVACGRTATLDDFSQEFLDDIAAKGFDWVWLLGVWQASRAARSIARLDQRLGEELRRVLPDLREEDICGSPFSIRAYQTNVDFGGDGALGRLRERLARRRLKLLLDFVPNHTAPDHPWVTEHPEYYVHGSEDDLAREPQNYVKVKLGRGTAILAHGRDPHFDAWQDTLQLNYRHAGFRQAQIGQLAAAAGVCDGVRCDMAMLMQPEIFRRTWGDRSAPRDGSPPADTPFWPEAIDAIRRRHPRFLFVAEAYWDMEWELQQSGFDFTYDKPLYDRLRAQAAVAVHDHLRADPSFQDRSLRFIENHDEPRAASIFEPLVHKAAAVVASLAPGLRLFHEGQLDGRKVRVPMQLGRRPPEPLDRDLHMFYERLLAVLQRPEVREGDFRLWSCRPAWDGNPTHEQFIVTSWQAGERRLLSAVNYGGSSAQCYVALGMPGLAGRMWSLADLTGDAQYRRHGDDLAGDGLYLDMLPWGHHVFELRPG